VLDSGQFVLGPEVEAFEQEFARYCGTAHAVGVSSGTSALHLALLAAGVGPGDDVVTVPFTFVATVAAIHYAGARPVFVDVEPGTLTMDPSRLQSALTPATKAIIPVHLHGQCADMDPILRVARARGLPVIEDAAQAHGAAYRGRPAGSLGDLGCFSFYPTKNLGAGGEGGMVVSASEELARRVRLLRDWGQEGKHRHVLKGYNYRLEALQAAILRVKLRHLPAWTAARSEHASRLSAGLRGAAVGLPVTAPERDHVFHVYAVRSPQRDALAAHLREQGIATGIHYPVPIHLQEAYRDSRYGLGDFPASEEAARTVLSLPMFPELAAAQIDTIVRAIASFEGAPPG
jgi:dTDP-4-amino-4,6-dideoxygalactose transaminase